MNRLVTLAAGCALLATGCAHDGEWSVWKALGKDEPPGRVATPDPKTIPRASFEIAERVETVGKKIIDQNTFTGIDPHFMTIGVKEAVLFHRDTEDLVISEGLVQKCKSDAELAAVLCAMLGQMVTDKRTAIAAGYNTDPIPETNADAPLFPEGSGAVVSRPTNPTPPKKTVPRTPTPIDPVDCARDLLRGAGFDPAELDRVEPLLKQSDRGEKLRKQMTPSAAAPDWQR